MARSTHIIPTRAFVIDYISQFVTIDESTNNDIDAILRSVPKMMKEDDFVLFVANYYAQHISHDPINGTIAAHMRISLLHQNTQPDICSTYQLTPTVTSHFRELVTLHRAAINERIDFGRDYDIDFFGLCTLESAYLLRDSNGRIAERPQQLFMRVALTIHEHDLVAAFETYDLMSQRYFVHATPTLFNAGNRTGQMSSCFLLGVDDSLDSIAAQQAQIHAISKWGGGIGIHLSDIRTRGSRIRGTGGLSQGIIPLCVILGKIARYVNQGGKRSGSVCVYYEPWCADIFEFCELRRTTSGSDDNRARDLFLALWVPDLFMKRVLNDESWSLMCPDECPGLTTSHSDAFEALYMQYESEGKYKKQVSARALWDHIISCQLESGMPYVLFKDHANRKSNQQNLGTIKSSNLCAEIIEYSDAQQTAVCNLASICLPRFVIRNADHPSFDFAALMHVTRVVVRNLNKIIDINCYINDSTRASNVYSRPIGIGVQGLANVYNLYSIAYDSDEASHVNKQIFEHIYYAAVHESMLLAQQYGSHDAHNGSPFSQGKLQFHLWGLTEHDLVTHDILDWTSLASQVRIHGTRNSLLTALMPTASTSQIMGCSESFDPIMSNLYIRSTLAGEFIAINAHLVSDLKQIGMWNDDMREQIILSNGSIQAIEHIPHHIKQVYKTAFEISLKRAITQAAERGPFIDQSQSMNLHVAPSATHNARDIIASSLFHAWRSGLKTGSYYIRTKPATQAQTFGVDISRSHEPTCTTCSA